MSSAAERTERQAEVVAELVALGLDFARELKRRIAAVETVAEAEKLARAFHRATRTVRLALALESRLAREGHEIARLDGARDRLAAFDRKRQVRRAVVRDIWTETEGEAAEALTEALDERLEEAAEFAEFLDGPVEAAIARIRADLGLAKALAAPADPPANDGAATPLRRSSA